MLNNFFTTVNQSESIKLPISFYMLEEKVLHLSEAYDPYQAWKYLTHYIHRDPHDLRAHVQRILLTTNSAMLVRLPGSLQDLFLALGNAGVGLKENMLAVASPHLTEDERHYFSQWITEGFEQGQDFHWRRGSVLSQGYQARPQRLVLQEKSVEVSEYSSVLEEVYACLEYGQVDVAQALLEVECVKVGHDEQLDIELLNIYLHTRDRQRLEEIAERVKESGQILTEGWMRILQEAKAW